MNGWLIAATALMLALVGPGYLVVRGTLLEAVVGLELGGVLSTLTMVTLAEGFHRKPFMDLAIVAGLMSFIGALAFVRFMERWS